MVIIMENRYALIKDNVVVNVIVADSEFANEHGYIECPTHTEEGHGVGPGCLYQNGVFSKAPRNLDAEWFVIRETRNYLLLASDINVLPDRWAAMTTEQQTAWSTYRQALRDIPTTFSDPVDVVWPVAP